jgi:hypothetical protein
MKTWHRRLDLLEQTAADLEQRHAASDWPTEEDWLAWFTAWGDEGHFACEPDFHVALACYAEALRQAHDQADPPFEPPADFYRDLHDLPQLRLLHWRNVTRFPALHEGLGWLSEIRRRVNDGTPPMTEAEFRDLVASFEASYARLREIAGPNTLLDVGEGKKESLANLRYAIGQGPQERGAGELAQALRWLRQRHG